MTDERDVIFARMNLKPGSPQYIAYYEGKQELKEGDDALRALPAMGSEEGKVYDRMTSPLVDGCFHFLSDMRHLAEGEENPKRAETDPQNMTDRLKGLAAYYGAGVVGVTKMKDEHYYTHRGRHLENHGEPVVNRHRYGIVFAVEMEKELIFKAPMQPEAVAVTKGYIQASIIGMVLSYYIRELGYPARNHMDGNYLVIAPLVAQDAGIGEIGRNGLLSTTASGPRVRLGVVTTDLPLVPDLRMDFGVSQLCETCGNCAKRCPAKAIPEGGKTGEAGQERWKVDAERCYARWRELGTDCGICLAACPLSTSVPSDLVCRMKESEEARKEIVERFHAEHGNRAFNSKRIPWLE